MKTSENFPVPTATRSPTTSSLIVLNDPFSSSTVAEAGKQGGLLGSSGAGVRIAPSGANAGGVMASVDEGDGINDADGARVKPGKGDSNADSNAATVGAAEAEGGRTEVEGSDDGTAEADEDVEGAAEVEDVIEGAGVSEEETEGSADCEGAGVGAAD